MVYAGAESRRDAEALKQAAVRHGYGDARIQTREQYSERHAKDDRLAAGK